MIDQSLSASLLQGFGVIAIVAVLYDLVLSQCSNDRCLRFGKALVFAFGGVAAMAVPFAISPGVVFDLRAVFLVLAASYGGWLAVIATVIATGAFRVWEAGIGVNSGLLAILLAAASGYAIQRFTRIDATTRGGLAVLALTVPITLLGLLLLPWEVASAIFVYAAVPTVLANMIGVMLVGEILNQKSQRLTTERQLRLAASTDAITGIATRGELERRGRNITAAAAADRTAFSVLMIDIDFFKRVNDLYGHDTGDQVLREMAHTVASCLRESDFVARYGGEEFVVLLPGQDARNALQVAERIRQQIQNRRFSRENPMLRVTASIGVFACADGQTSFEQAMTSADRALYAAKHAGRDCVRLFRASETAKSRHASGDRTGQFAA